VKRKGLEEFKLQVKLNIEDNHKKFSFLGLQDENLRIIESEIPVVISLRGDELLIRGEQKDVEIACEFLKQLKELVNVFSVLSPGEIKQALQIFKKDRNYSLLRIFGDICLVTHEGKQIKPKSIAQKEYIEAIRNFDLVFSIGPAGTGKTYLAVAMAIEALKSKQVIRVILARPAVEAGEKLGFLPGDISEKVDPYLRPLFDALLEMIGFERCQKLKEKGVLEIAPLAFMRGRSLNNSFIILDEAQNTTSEQMMMFLTRLGFGSKAVVTGDITQIDLPKGQMSGLIEAQQLLGGLEEVKFIYFTEQDVVRHPLVKKIIKIYEKKNKS